MGQLNGLPLHAQKAVTGRMLGLETLVPNLSLLESMGCHDAGKRLVERLYWITNETLSDPDGSGTIGDFLVSLVAELEDEAARLPSLARETVSRIIVSLTASVNAFAASPWDPLGELITVAAKTAAIYYDSFDIRVPDDLWHCAHPAISFYGGKVGLSFSPEIHFQLSTEFDPVKLPCAQVFIKVCPRWLDVDTVAALPRALLHEYVSHVPQGPHLGRRNHPDANDLFAEGWMDYVAHHIYRTALKRQGPSPLLADFLTPGWLSIHDIAGERFFAARCLLTDDDPASAARSEGAAAAHQIHDLFRRLPETALNPDKYLYRLSFGLNISKSDGLSRQIFVAEVRRRLLFASCSDFLIHALREWVAGRIDLEDLSVWLLD